MTAITSTLDPEIERELRLHTQRGHEKELSTLLKSIPKDQIISYLCNGVNNYLQQAAVHGDTDIAAILIKAVPKEERTAYLKSLTQEDSHYGLGRDLTALSWAVNAGHIDTAIMLITALPEAERADYLREGMEYPIGNITKTPESWLACLLIDLMKEQPSPLSKDDKDWGWTEAQMQCCAEQLLIAKDMPQYQQLLDPHGDTIKKSPNPASPEVTALKKTLLQSIAQRDDPVHDSPPCWSTERMHRELKKAGISRERYAGIKDMMQEIADCLLLPAIAFKAPTWRHPEMTDFTPLAWEWLSKHNDTLDLALLSEVWHRPDKAIPSSIRDCLPNRQWHPLFQDKDGHKYVDILIEGETWRVECLTSDKELQEEGGAMDHCVGRMGYGYKCAEGKAHIVAVRRVDRDENQTRYSTAEIEIAENQHKIIQHNRRKNVSVQDSEPAAQALATALDMLKTGEKLVLPKERYGETAESRERSKHNGSPLVQKIGFVPSLSKLADVIHHYQNEVRYAISSAHLKKRAAEESSQERRHASFGSHGSGHSLATEEKTVALHSLLGPVSHHEITTPSRRPVGEVPALWPEAILQSLDAQLDPYLEEKHDVRDPVSLAASYNISIVPDEQSRAVHIEESSTKRKR